MKRFLSNLAMLTLAGSILVLVAGCSDDTPEALTPSPWTSPLTSVLPTPLPETNKLPLLAGKLLLLVSDDTGSVPATLEIIDPDGGTRETLAQAASAPESVAISSDNRYIAFFTREPEYDGLLEVWDVEEGESAFQVAVPSEISTSFRDASAARYLTWSPDSQSLAIVMNRDLHLLDLASGELQTIIPHREAEYAFAGLVMDSIGRPSWTTDGHGIVYDAWSPPDVLSEGADDLRNVESVDISTGATEVILENARILHQPALGMQELILESQDGSLSSLDLTTLVLRGISSPTQDGSTVCEPQNQRCASIASDDQESDLIQVRTLSGETLVDDIGLTDLSQTLSDCQYQSVLWNHEGTELLATVGCEGHVSLWSINVADLEPSHIVDWTDAGSVTLLAWFE